MTLNQTTEGILASAIREDLAPSKRKPKKRVAMKWKGRPQSKNIEDTRNYFGSDAFDPGYSDEDRVRDFMMDAIHNPRVDAPQKFKRRTEKL